MKKSVLLTTVALITLATAIAENAAPRVIPLNITPVTYNVDSLKALAALDTNLYLAELERIQLQLKAEEQALKMAQHNLKAEQAHHKSQTNILKERQKFLKQQDKVYDKELKLHQKDRKELEKQRKAMARNSTIDARVQQQSLREMDMREQRINAAETHLSQKVNALNQQHEQLKNDMIALAEFKHSLQLKEIEIKNLQNNNKLRFSTIANEIKNIRTLLKASK